MKAWKKLATLLFALTLSIPCALMTACGDKDGDNADNTQQNGDNTGNADDENTDDNGNGNTDDNGDNADDGSNTTTPENPDSGNAGENEGENSTTTPENPDSGNTGENEGDTKENQLASPTLTMDGNVERWTTVENATKYVYKRGANGKEKETDGLYVTLTDGQTLYVKAISDGTTYQNSDWAEITYTYTDPYIAPPAWDRKPSFSSFTSGNGGEYSRYEGREGYYELTLKAGETKYYSFAVSKAGQYALVTEKKKTGLTIERCDASAQYIAPSTYPAQVLNDETLYSYVHCSNWHFNAEWRATYKISSTTNGTINVRFVRVGDALPEPERKVTNIKAKEIVGKAQDFSQSFVATEVPWLALDNPTYFYDADYEMTFTDLVTGEEKTAKGFYRMGTKDNPGAVIYVAINTAPSRYLGKALSTIQYDGDNLTLHVDTDVDGNYLFDSYIDFIMNNGALIDNENGGVPMPGDETMLCYMNAANTDGMFPVNQELFDFLNTYITLNPPLLDDGVTVNTQDYWLAPCYYYVEQELGSKKNPIELSIGENTITLEAMASKYYKLSLSDSTSYTFVGETGLIAFIDGTNYGVNTDGFNVTITATVDSLSGELIIECKSFTTGEYTLTITETPIIDTEEENDGNTEGDTEGGAE